jgi:hypothetical protein
MGIQIVVLSHFPFLPSSIELDHRLRLDHRHHPKGVCDGYYHCWAAIGDFHEILPQTNWHLVMLILKLNFLGRF